MASVTEQPTVCAVMLTKDRPAMARRAVECFRDQTYPNRRLVVAMPSVSWAQYMPVISRLTEQTIMLMQDDSRTIGELRNSANREAYAGTDILIHWDDDDWSHPNRIAQQVELLQKSKADAVGYREMLFWREPGAGGVHGCRVCEKIICRCPGEAWIYTNGDPSYCLGTSLCYWRRTWERNPFRALTVGEDADWICGLKTVGRSAIGHPFAELSPRIGEPRMIARIHPGNTSDAYAPAKMAVAPLHWKRVPEWDAYCKTVMV